MNKKKDKPISRADMSIYRDKKLIKSGKDDQAENMQRKYFWWQAEPDKMADSIISAIKYMEEHQHGRVNQLVSSTRLYSNSTVSGFLGGSFRTSYGQALNSSPGSGRISYNLCASLVDTLTAHMAKNKVVPMFITSGGIWGAQKQAEQLSKFIEGCFYANNIHKMGINVFRDAGVWGTGILHIYNNNDEIAVEKVFPHEIIIDEVEALNGMPQQMHRVKLVDRNLLLNMFKDDEEACKKIVNATTVSNLDIGAVDSTAADLVSVVESWHLASSEEAKDGLHVICLGSDSSDVLFQEDYEKTYFPFVFYHYNKRLVGFWGQGAVERVQNLQCEVNKLMILIQKAMWMGGGYKILMENGSKIVKQHFDNEVGTIITYSNTPPAYISPPFLQAEIYPYVDALIAKAYQQEGVSQLAAASLKPQGVDSGAALRTFDEIAEDRQLFIAQELETFYLEVARQMIETARDICKKKKSYKVQYPGTMSFEVIDWKDIKLKKSEYVMKAFPTSQLPEEPGAKFQTVKEYMEAGFISPRAGRRLLSMPDIEMSDKLANAAEDLLHKVIEDMLNDGTYRSPEPYYDLDLAKQLCMQYYNYADLNNAPEDRLELVRQFNNAIDDLKQQAQVPGQNIGIPNNPPPMPQPSNNAVPQQPPVQQG